MDLAAVNSVIATALVVVNFDTVMHLYTLINVCDLSGFLSLCLFIEHLFVQ